MPKNHPRNSDSTANLGFEAKLWLAADKLRNNMHAAELIDLIGSSHLSARPPSPFLSQGELTVCRSVPAGHRVDRQLSIGAVARSLPRPAQRGEGRGEGPFPVLFPLSSRFDPDSDSDSTQRSANKQLPSPLAPSPR
jgi:hypothetical protein